MTLTLWTLIAIQIAMASFDTIYHHELTERLAWRPSQRHELTLHAARSLIYAALFLVLGFLEPHGVFATRSPRRPNPIGLSIVRLVRVEGATLNIEEVDLVDGAPVLDIKPYVPQLDDRNAEGTGWFAENVHKVHEVRADDRIR